MTFTAMASQAATLDGINNTVNSINNKVTSINTKTNAISTVKTSVDTVKENLQNLPTTVQSSLGFSLDPEIKSTVLQALVDVKNLLDKQKLDLQNFGDGTNGTGCFDFRELLKSLSLDTVDIAIILQSAGAASIPGPPDGAITAQFTQGIDLIPCKLLLPAYAALTQTPLGDVTDRLTTVRDSLTVLMPLLEVGPATAVAESPGSNSPGFGLMAVSVPDACPAIAENQAAISEAVSRMKTTSIVMKVVGEKFKVGPIYQTDFEISETDVGVHGYAHMTLKKPESKKEKMAQIFINIAGHLDTVSSFASEKLSRCATSVNLDRVYQNQQMIFAEICGISRYRSAACQSALP